MQVHGAHLEARIQGHPERKNIGIQYLLNRQGETACLKGIFLCHSKNKPPAMQGEGRSLDISMSSCAIIEVGLQNHK